jgi:hypothetical protein
MISAERAAGPAKPARQISLSEGQPHPRERTSCMTAAPKKVLLFHGPARAKRLLLEWRALPSYAGSLLAREWTVRGVVGRLLSDVKRCLKRAQGALGSHTPCEPGSRRAVTSVPARRAPDTSHWALAGRSPIIQFEVWQASSIVAVTRVARLSLKKARTLIPATRAPETSVWRLPSFTTMAQEVSVRGGGQPWPIEAMMKTVQLAQPALVARPVLGFPRRDDALTYAGAVAWQPGSVPTTGT